MLYNYIASILDTSIFGIGLYNSENNSIEFNSLIENGKTIRGFSRQLDDPTSCAAWCYNKQQYILLNNFPEEYKKYITEIKNETSKTPGSVIFLTLTVKDKKIGVLTIQSYNQNAYTQGDLDTIQTLASYLAIALDNANAHKIVRTQKTELESQHIILEEQVKERTKDLEAAKLKAEESDRLKSSFLANMSHEIRTPLNAIVGFSNVIVSDEFDENEKHEIFGMIEQNSLSLLNIISDIIDFSKIEAGQMDFQITEVELEPILKELLQTFTHQIQKKELAKLITLKLKTPYGANNVTLKTDAFRLKQIFNNLISNAIKFTYKGIIEFGFRESTNGFLVLYVKDSGIGIKEENKDRIFDRFIKIEEDRNIVYRGTGLGLSITKYLVESLGGKIWVESEYNKGSEFIFELPLKESLAHVAKEGIRLSENTNFITPDWHSKTVLVVEDESSNYRLIEMLLKSTHIKIKWAKDGSEAIEQLNKLKDLIDLVLLDIKLPKKDGFTVFKEIRTVNDSLPIIAQTAYAMQKEEDKIRKSGFNDYLSKPLVKQKLIESMSRFI
jgi:signal transduction histidine kinase/CheY-like chemotaxis protein